MSEANTVISDDITRLLCAPLTFVYHMHRQPYWHSLSSTNKFGDSKSSAGGWDATTTANLGGFGDDQLIAPISGIPDGRTRREINFRTGKRGRRTRSIVLLRMQRHLVRLRACTHIQMINFLYRRGRPPRMDCGLDVRLVRCGVLGEVTLIDLRPGVRARW